MPTLCTGLQQVTGFFLVDGVHKNGEWRLELPGTAGRGRMGRPCRGTGFNDDPLCIWTVCTSISINQSCKIYIQSIPVVLEFFMCDMMSKCVRGHY